VTTFRIADTFTDSLARLTGDEQKAVKTTAFDLQLNPVNSGLSFHRLDKAKDRNFWSVRVNRDVRVIVHRMPGSLMLCYVDHHDKAYAWAERRKLEVHPATAAAQFVEIRERIEEILVPVYMAREAPQPAAVCLFAAYSDDTLLSYGVPAEWLDAVHQATEESLLALAEHLPQEAAEALLDVATGVEPKVRLAPAAATVDPFEHPDAQRRFRVVTDVEELTRALEFPWDKWTVFLHPAQGAVVAREFSGPARVSGPAGTGKTVVALHRAVALAKTNGEARVLLTTYTDTLANALKGKLRRLIGTEPRLGERLEVHALDAIGRRLYEKTFGRATFATPATMQELIRRASDASPPLKLSASFLLSEWEDIVDAWQLTTWDAYRDVARLGRKTRLPEKQRREAWAIFERVWSALGEKEMVTQAGAFARLAKHFAEAKSRPFDHVVVDESQDLTPPQLQFLAAFGTHNPNGLFFAGDLGQRIFQPAFSWLQLGVDIRGRSSTLRVNYRTSHQIRAQADRLLDPKLADVDGVAEQRGAVSVFNGPTPTVATFDSADEECERVGQWLAERIQGGAAAGEIGVFVRSAGQFDRARRAVERAGLPFRVLDDRVDTSSASASIATMHLAKGLEFRVVAVMACDDEALPLQSRIEAVSDDADLEEVYNTERQLLYVACTRARDQLMVSGVRPESEFLDDLVKTARS
jgi:hypothetical protein